MPVPQLPVELIKLIVTDPVLEKGNLQSVSLTARAFPPLVRPALFRSLEIPLRWITEAEDAEPQDTVNQGRAITLAEMERLMAFRLRPDLAALVKKVSIHSDDDFPDLEPPPGSIRMMPHDLMQLVYTVFPRLEKVGSHCLTASIVPPRQSPPCCQTLHTIQDLILDADTWTSLQTCSALRKLSIETNSFEGGIPAIPPVLPFRLETLEVYDTYQINWEVVFLRPFLRACGPTLKHLRLGLNFDDVLDFLILPNLVILGVYMSDREGEQVDGQFLSAWFTVALPTCVALERLTIETNYALLPLPKTPQGLLAIPEVAAALPATLRRIDFDTPPHDREIEAALKNNRSVRILGIPSEVSPARRITVLLAQDSLVDFPVCCLCRGVTVRGLTFATNAASR
jgi:hypothetical protein